MSTDVQAEIRALVDRFVADLEALVRRAALETVAQALAAPGAAAAAPPVRARRPDLPPRPATQDGGRVRRSSDQIEATSERILRHVQEHPGTRSEDIRAALGLAKNEWQLTAKRLVDAGRLATRGEKRATAYFIKGAPRFGVVRRPGRGAPATPALDDDARAEAPADLDDGDD